MKELAHAERRSQCPQCPVLHRERRRRHDPVVLPGLDMIKASVAPIVGNFFYENVRSPETRAYRVVSRYFDPQGARIGILLKTVEAVENSPFL
ncbi:hypothetical protein [Limimaricola soesokkakensis]|nr:hypothetical protein [Limimaricola soesokkakensis]